MRPFEFIIVFLSFIYTLALTHLLLAAAQMIRHRRELRFSWPHALWMLSALLLLAGNWLSLWDFHGLSMMSLPTIAAGFLLVVTQYLICVLVTPDLDREAGYDLRRFHERESGTYLGAFLAMMFLALALNAAAGSGLGVANWSHQNLLVLAMLAPIVAALTVRRPWVQVAAPLVMVGLQLAFPILYYPVLQ